MPESINLSALIATDRDRKPEGAEDEWSDLVAYYEDTSRSKTRSRLKDRGQGKEAGKPLELQLLQKIINRIATIWESPPTRWLARSNRRSTP